MVQSLAKTVREYLAELPPGRREVIGAMRKVVIGNLPAGYEEAIRHGMICWEVPLSRYPTTYNKEPLLHVALAAQKNYYALYLTCVYGDPAREKELRDGFAAAEKKLDMGKSCLRFKRLEDLPLPLLAKLVGSMSVEALIARYEAQRKK